MNYTVSKETREVIAAVHPSYFGEYAALFKELSDAFREMGFVILPANTTMNGFLDLIKKGDVDLGIGRWVADYPDADTFANGVLQSQEGFWGRIVGSPEIDDLVERGRSEVDPDARHSIYRQLEDLIARDALLIPLFHEQIYHFVRPEVEGHSLGFALPTVAYENLSIRKN